MTVHVLRNLRFEIADDGVGLALLDMPGRPFNVFSDDMIDELEKLIGIISSRASLRGVVIASAKNAFMAGADLAMVQGFTTLRFERTPAEIRHVFSRLTYTLRKLERVRVPTVAAVNGLALGGGLELAMACAEPDALISSAHAMARHASPGARWDRAGWHAPRDVEQLLDGPQAVERLLTLACCGPHVAHLYPAVGAIINCLRDGYHRDIDSGIEVEIDSFLPLMLGAVAGNMVRTGFLSKTAAPKRAATRLGGLQAAVERIAIAGVDPAPARLAKRFTVVTNNASADACLIFGAAPAALDGSCNIRVRQTLSATPADGEAELRVVDAFERAEFAEIAGPVCAATARALAIANRLRMTPVVTTGDGDGPSQRLLEVTRRHAQQHIATPAARAAVAQALDLEPLFARAGLAVDELAAWTDVDRVKGLELLTTVALEAARLLDEGVLTSAEEVDVLAVVGLGFPAWSGGPLSYLDMLRRGEMPDARLPAGLRAAPYYAH